MKIYHKFLLYQNKWIHPYVRMTVGVMTSITYLASILLIVGVVYEHGFTISEVEAHQLQRLYHGVWIVFLVVSPFAFCWNTRIPGAPSVSSPGY